MHTHPHPDHEGHRCGWDDPPYGGSMWRKAVREAEEMERRYRDRPEDRPHGRPSAPEPDTTWCGQCVVRSWQPERYSGPCPVCGRKLEEAA